MLHIFINDTNDTCIIFKNKVYKSTYIYLGWDYRPAFGLEDKFCRVLKIDFANKITNSCSFSITKGIL